MESKPRPAQPCNALPAHRWQRLRGLRDVCQLNEHLLDVLAEATRSGLSGGPEVLSGNAALLASMDPGARRCAAQIPIVLVDLNFSDEDWWQSAANAADNFNNAVAGLPMPYQWQPEATREVLMLAWPAVREDRAVASLLFGMSPSVADLLASLGPRQLDFIGSKLCSELQPRWWASHGFWRRLLSAAIARNDGALAEVRLYALQLLGGELMRTQKQAREATAHVNTRASRAVLSHSRS